MSDAGGVARTARPFLVDTGPPSGSTGELDAWLATSDAADRRVLLAVLYRLASVEADLADLRAQIERASPAVHARRRTRRNAPTSKSNVLEQVFRSNLTLRRMCE